jgi:hypothetical protein
MRLRQGFLLLCLAMAGQALGAHLAAPQGLTLSVQPGGVWRLVWDPIMDDSLMGYTVLARPEGRAEYARLTKASISHALFQFRGLPAGQDEELVVVADYETGHSAPSKPAHTRLAVPAPADAASQAALKPERPGQKPEPQAEATPFFSAPVRPGRGLLIGRGQLDARVNLGYDIESFVSNGWGYVNQPNSNTGTMPFNLIDYYNYDPSRLYYWEEVNSRTIFSIPLTVRYGLLDAVELGVTGAWHSESAIFERATVNGNEYNSTINMPEMHTSGLADTTAYIKLQPVTQWPFLLSAEMVLPTGASRFTAYASYITDVALGVPPTLEAGTGDGVTRFTLRTQWGWKALKPGMFYEAAYTPSASEDYSMTVSGLTLDHHADFGEIWEGGFGYTLPWDVVQGQGSLVVGVIGRSIKPGSWTVDGNSMVAPTDTYDAGAVHTYANLNLVENNEMEIYAEVDQDFTQYLGTNCKAYWRSESDGYTYGICGGVVY